MNMWRRWITHLSHGYLLAPVIQEQVKQPDDKFKICEVLHTVSSQTLGSLNDMKHTWLNHVLV